MRIPFVRNVHMRCGTVMIARQRLTQKRKYILLNSHFFVFYVHKKYSRSFINLRLNHWCHMDYFNDILTTLNVVATCLCRVRKLSDFIKNILICVSKMNKCLWNDMRVSNKWQNFPFLGELALWTYHCFWSLTRERWQWQDKTTGGQNPEVNQRPNWPAVNSAWREWKIPRRNA